MRIKLTDAVHIRGELHRAGEVLDLPPGDFLDVLACGRGVALEIGDHAAALDESNRQMLRLERARHWRQ